MFSLQEHVAAVVARMGHFLIENERLLVVAASTMIMSLSHTALRPVLPVFAKVNVFHSPLPIVILCLLVCVRPAPSSGLLHPRSVTTVNPATPSA